MGLIDAQSAKDRLKDHRIDAIGLAAPALAAQWTSGSNPVYTDKAGSPALTLTFSANWRAPVGGVLTYSANGSDLISELDGNALAGNAALLTLHPQAYLRLARLYAVRYGGSGSHALRPVPRFVAIRVSTLPSPLPGVGEVRTGQDLPPGGVSFYDERGLVIDPLAAASVWTDLLTTYPALLEPNFTLASGDLTAHDGYCGKIAQLVDGTSSKRFVHIVDPHGNPWQDPGSGFGLTITSGGSHTRIDGSGPFELPGGATIDAEAAAPQLLRFGFATTGTLAATSLNIPALGSGVTLTRDFIRVCALHRDRFLIGNRTASIVDGIGGVDAGSAAEAAPIVREGARVRYLVDGIAVLGALSEMLTTVAGSSTSYEPFAAAPAISAAFDLPRDSTPASRWPSAASADIMPPGPSPTPAPWDVGKSSPLRPDAMVSPGVAGIVASWHAATGSDVLITIAPELVPPGAHVRIYPRVFVVGPSLAESPTLFRGDGGAAIAGPATDPVHVVLLDPLGIGTNPRPSTPHLRFDLHVVPRPATGATRERIFGGYDLPIAAFGTSWMHAAGTNALGFVPDNRRALCSSPVLGLPPRPGPPFAIGNPSDLIAIVKALASETTPREGPRFPTMARFDAVAAFGTNTKAPPVTWNALTTGGFLTAETHAEQYHRGNPGGPAAPEIHAAGIALDGQLAYDLALAGNRRVNDLLTRLMDYDGAAWDPLSAPALPTTFAGAVSQTIAPYCETPELAALPESQLAGLPNNWNDIQTAIKKYLPITLTVTNGDRIVQEVKRELYAARYGRRDFQWALRHAIGHARELIYIESQAFNGTAYPSLSDTSTWDLVQAIVDRMGAQPSLRVIIVVPKKLAFGKQYASWAKYGYTARSDAYSQLQSAGVDRVTLLHPIGFPGRSLNIRTTIAVIDDVWCSVGTSAMRRRGFTFDGGEDVVTTDLARVDGRCAAIVTFRRALMAQFFGLKPPGAGEIAHPNWVRLAHPRTAFEATKELVDEGGRGLVEPIWAGPSDATVIAQSRDVADPDGRVTSSLLTMLVSGLADLESNPA